MPSQLEIHNPGYMKKHVRFETSNQNDISLDCQMPRSSCNKLMTVQSINAPHYTNNFISPKVSYEVPKSTYSFGNANEFVGPCKDLELSIYDEGKANSCFKGSSEQYTDEMCPVAPKKLIACPPIGNNNNWPNLNRQNKSVDKVVINNNAQPSTEHMSTKRQTSHDFFINPGESPTSYFNKIPQYKNMILPNVPAKFNENTNSKAWKPKKEALYRPEYKLGSKIKENRPQPLGKMVLAGSELCRHQGRHESEKCVPIPYCSNKYGARQQENCLQDYCSQSRTAMTEMNYSNCDVSSPHYCCLGRHASEPRRNNIDVEDLVQIIKIQNGQLQMLQEQVTKLMALNDKGNALSEPQINMPESTAEILNKQSLLSPGMMAPDNKMSIGVMTSFEMVRTYSSTIGQHDQGCNNVQCNKSQISITEVISATKQNVNFLDGLKPRSDGNNFKDTLGQKSACNNVSEMNSVQVDCTQSKLANDLSLADIQLEDLKSPQPSPQPSMRLDMQDFSDSDPDEQAVEGWTYYNKVMDRVNDILYTPTSSTSILRNQRRQTNVDRAKASPKPFQKTVSSDISTFKRVTFNENVEIDLKPRPKMCDTSMKMNELARKYLQNYEQRECAHGPARSQGAGKNLLNENGLYRTDSPPNAPNAGRFLDLASLRQQPKLL